MIRKDDRTPEQQNTHTLLVVGTDSFLSGWGQASGGASVAAWACTDAQLSTAETRIRNRSDMKRVRVVIDRKGDRYYPRGNVKHLHIYVFNS